MTPRLLITGATGFLGLPCVRYALAAGVEVHATARSGAELMPPGVTFHAVDMFESVEVLKLCHQGGFTHLLHLAWITTPGAYWTSDENRQWESETFHLVTAFKSFNGKRAVVAGTCAEYDWSVNGPCHETQTPIRPATVYGRWKAETCRAVVLSTAGSDFSFAWPRLFFLYGPREHPARLVPYVTNALLAGQPAECTAGTQERDFLHVDDAATALVQLVLSDVTGPVNIGSGEAVSVRTVVESIADIVGRPDLLRLAAKPMPPNDPPLLVADVGRLRNELKWAPRIGLRQGLEETVAWWRGRNAG